MADCGLLRPIGPSPTQRRPNSPFGFISPKEKKKNKMEPISSSVVRPMLGSLRLSPAASSALRPTVEPLFSLPYLPTIFHSRFEGFYLKWWRTGRMWQRRCIPALLRPLQRRPSAPAARFSSDGNASRRRRLGFRRGASREERKRVLALRVDRPLF